MQETEYFTESKMVKKQPIVLTDMHRWNDRQRHHCKSGNFEFQGPQDEYFRQKPQSKSFMSTVLPFNSTVRKVTQNIITI